MGIVLKIPANENKMVFKLEDNLYLLEERIRNATGKPGPVEVLLDLVKTPTVELAAKLYPNMPIEKVDGQALLIRGWALNALREYLHGHSPELYEGF